MSAGRIDDHVGGELLLHAVDGRADPGDPRLRRHEPKTADVRSHAHVGQPPDTVADRVFQQRPPQRHAAHAAFADREASTGEDPCGVAQVVSRGASAPHQLLCEARQQLLERLQTAGQQAVGVGPLGRARARVRFVRKLPPLEHEDIVE